jgi:hypothetical protein
MLQKASCDYDNDSFHEALKYNPVRREESTFYSQYGIFIHQFSHFRLASSGPINFLCTEITLLLRLMLVRAENL